MSEGDLILALPSKGRLMARAVALFAEAGLPVENTSERGYRARLKGLEGVTVAYLSAGEIAHQLKMGKVHLGITGEDLLREAMPDADEKLTFLRPLGFGRADVVVAVPACWLDVRHMGDLDDVSQQFHRHHGRRLRVATKYQRLTRRFFAAKAIAGYRIVESLGATEGAPAAGAAELIVDITSTGATLRDNHLKILADGVILRSQAMLVESRVANWSDSAQKLRDDILARLPAVST